MLAINRLSLLYGDAIALSEVSLQVKPGQLVAILGANGAGKSSLIKAICGIHKSSQGSIIFEDKNITNLLPHQICHIGIGIVAEGRQVFPNLSVSENLIVGGYAKGFKGKKIDQNLEKIYDFFPKLKIRAKQLAGTMSGGEQQMLAIGRCLMADPKMILLDEPSLGLSPVMVQEMFSLVKSLHIQGMTMLLVEQNVVASLQLADYAYVLETGTIAMQGASHDLLNNEDVKQAYFGI